MHRALVARLAIGPGVLTLGALVPTMLARRRRGVWLALLGILAGGAACAEQRGDATSDSAGARSAVGDAEAAFLAQRGRTWELARIGTRDIPAPPIRPATPSPNRHPGPGSRPTIRFTAEPETTLFPDSALSRAGGWSFCNGYGTGYRIGPGDQLRFRGFQSTLVGCDGPDSLESRFFRGLSATRRFTLDSATLVLIAEDGSRLTFVAAEAERPVGTGP